MLCPTRCLAEPGASQVANWLWSHFSLDAPVRDQPHDGDDHIAGSAIHGCVPCDTIQLARVVIPLSFAVAHRSFAARDSFCLPSVVSPLMVRRLLEFRPFWLRFAAFALDEEVAFASMNALARSMLSAASDKSRIGILPSVYCLITENSNSSAFLNLLIAFLAFMGLTLL